MKKIKVNKTVKGMCALAMGCAAMALGLASVVFSIPAQIAGWGADKLFDGASKLMGVKHETAHTDREKRWEDINKTLTVEDANAE